MARNNEQLSALWDALFRVIDKLDSAAIEYMITGSVAGFIWGMNRFTQDIDIVISIENIIPKTILNIFPKALYYIAETSLTNTFSGKENIINIIELKNYIKFDLISLERTDFGTVKFRRKQEIHFSGNKIWVISPEDLVLSKLNWLKLGESEQQRNDIIAIVDLIDLDIKYITDWAKKLGTFKLWQDLSTRHPKPTK